MLRRGNPSRRLNLAMLCIAFVLTLFAARLVEMQGFDSAAYQKKAANQRLKVISIPAVRGAITASDGTVLAMTARTDLVFADPTRMPSSERADAAAKLAGPLGLPAEQILGLINGAAPGNEYVVLARNVPAAAGDAIEKLNLPGIGETPSYARVYPNGNLAANLLGFATAPGGGGDLRGQAGLEYKYNSLLAGKDGKQEVEAGSDGQPIPFTPDKVQPAVPAGSLRLTIQPDLQWEAQRACHAQVLRTRADNCSVVIMQPRTGRILAMAQYPSFNPSHPASLAATQDLPVSDVFEPGSTGKVITVAAALEHGGQTPMSPYTIPDKILVDGLYPFRDAEFHPTEHLTVAGILAHSSNVGMVQVVKHVPPQMQYRYYRKFGLGAPTGLGLPGESAGLLPKPSQWSGNTRYTLSFGQGVAVTAVQMASLYATIANGGVRVSPSIVAGETSGKGKFTPAPPPKRTRVLRARTAHELLAILQQVPHVDDLGGEPWGEIAGYTVAAKTGTAQLPDPAKGGCLCMYGSSYIGIAPADDPQLVVAVHVQNPKRRGYFGDAVAGPVFNRVMKFALQTLQIPPDHSKPPKVRLTAP
ncbi:MAG TPA: penicillin-binding protein 2 [Streptosporangiaceae bacterium]|jgi:cell division protein FtsI (penicillin-binding protein 3)|nr:penicillin-binding protein 2 [Streptosporangiaceae bacterium]